MLTEPFEMSVLNRLSENPVPAWIACDCNKVMALLSSQMEIYIPRGLLLLYLYFVRLAFQTLTVLAIRAQLIGKFGNERP
jgi:hypothetical protein